MNRWLLVALVVALGRLAAGELLLVPPLSVPQALKQAHDGDTIQVDGGVHLGPVVVERAVHLVGIHGPVLDGQGAGTVVLLKASGASLEGFEVRGSGCEPDQDHSGITMTGARQRVANNRLRDVLFGIFVSRSDDSLVTGNDIESKSKYDTARKGDSIRVWYSQRVRVEGNRVRAARDLVAWYSGDLVMSGNDVAGGRYGIHFMYCNGALVEGNRLESNSVGIYSMYSQGMVLRSNRVRSSRGTSGYGLGFKDTEGVLAESNVLSENRVGIYYDGAAGQTDFRDNVLAYNDIAVTLQPSDRGVHLSQNSFWENGEQVSVAGGGPCPGNRWEGNYWSDYEGFDANGDGVGDLPYRSEKLFDSLADRQPDLRFFAYTPAQRALELAARLFPVVRPVPRLEDPAPCMSPPIKPESTPARLDGPALVSSLVLIFLGVTAVRASKVAFA